MLSYNVIGSHGASKHVQLVAFPTVAGAIDFLRNECRCNNIIGLLGAFPDAYSDTGYNLVHDESNQLFQISSDASIGGQGLQTSYPVDCYPFQSGNTCIVSGRVSRGLSSVFLDHCSGFIHVPYLGAAEPVGMPCLLDTQSILSIVLHHYTNWAGYNEHTFQGHKYAVTLTSKTIKGDVQVKQQELREQIRRENETRADEAVDGAAGTLFEQNDTNGDY